MKKKILIILTAGLLAIGLTGCRESDKVDYNLGVDADNFNVVREITVFNTRTDTVLFQMAGRMSLKNDGNNELTVIVEEGKNKYKKHFIYLSNDTTYVVEDVTGLFEDKFYYKLELLPFGVYPSVSEIKEGYK